ncbi:MAG: flagellar biosynthesis protein FlhF [Deltaproteobacteria bacterium]
MKIRRYMGKDAHEAMLKVKMDLGNEAVIINTRRVKQKGIMGFFKKPLIEVLATLDDSGKKPQESKQMEKNEDNKNKLEEEMKLKDYKLNQLEAKVSNIEGLLQKLSGQLQPGAKAVQEAQQDFNSKVYQLFTNNLLRNEVEPELAKKIIQMVKEKVGNSENVSEVASTLYNTLQSFLGKPEAIQLPENKKPYIVILLGPTGVGKTTTLAKIAADFALNQKKSVGLITSDTFRIAAVEQLKTYAEILGMPVSVIYSPNEINEAINNYSDKDIILIDTPGRSHKNKSQFEELKALVSNSHADEFYLLIGATTGMKNCREIIKSYSFIDNYKLLFTKVDETSSYGIILNVKEMTGKPLSYVTIGQSVPDDIEIINIDKISKILLGSIPA